MRGLSTGDISGGTAGIYTPGPASASILVPQCIAWPFSTDDAGASYPSGIVGIRSVSPGRTTEKAWGTPGDPLEDRDDWIAVPDTLPGAYTSRPGRDISRGPNGSATTKGSCYLKVTTNGAGLSPTTASSNYFDPGGLNGYRMLSDWLVNGQAVTGTGDHMPSYRPRSGGGIVKPGWFPLNSGKSVLDCIYYESSGGVPLPGLSSAVTSKPNFNGGMALWTKHGPGFRSATWRYTAIATPAAWALAGNVIAVQFIIGHNASWAQTGYGDTNDYASPVFGKSDFVTDGVDYGFGLRYYTLTHTSTSGVSTTRASGMRSWICGYGTGQSPLWAGNFSGTPGTLHASHTKRLWLSPRVDIPAAFSVYGAGVGAPGGV